jgi:hypothetical protein
MEAGSSAEEGASSMTRAGQVSESTGRTEALERMSGMLAWVRAEAIWWARSWDWVTQAACAVSQGR